jgi:hypothetical protein
MSVTQEQPVVGSCAETPFYINYCLDLTGLGTYALLPVLLPLDAHFCYSISLSLQVRWRWSGYYFSSFTLSLLPIIGWALFSLVVSVVVSVRSIVLVLTV